ncbi:nitrilase [Dothidotthia symphoricarpi CBS 119687]|uniref:Nitrilase n=1 Tax=Dothidotthia symphoricarpi CBS 119687 TaxID=1392245 RepID=A0A6A6AMD7_9PLEO|nr:nitrilase [Dothidotthia symphoricarpi CBS 119687]KAF2131641.1 nitrilase [Dothidotthia symphoricarpi CBS 119687]
MSPIAAIGQTRSTASPARNLAQCQSLVKKASLAGASALFLPEACDYMAPDTATSLSLCQPVEKSEFVLGLQASAREYNIAINVGIHEPADGKKVKNTLLWIDEKGAITQRYQKLHLLEMDIKNGVTLKEENSVERGAKIVDPFPTAVGILGLQICFDMRFSEPALALRARGAQILTYPSAFTVPTGKAGHWEILLRARAIETQSYVIAAGQVGAHDDEGKRESYGHSMIIDPWGKVIAKMDGAESEGGNEEGEIAFAEIDIDYVEQIRQEITLKRRTDVYPDIK